MRENPIKCHDAMAKDVIKLYRTSHVSTIKLFAVCNCILCTEHNIRFFYVVPRISLNFLKVLLVISTRYLGSKPTLIFNKPM